MKNTNQISITPVAHDKLQSLTSELRMTPRAVASVILGHYCSRAAFMKTLGLPENAVPGIADSTTDKRAHLVRITSAAYEQLRSLASELGMTLRAVASDILEYYCSREDFEKALVEPPVEGPEPSGGRFSIQPFQTR